MVIPASWQQWALRLQQPLLLLTTALQCRAKANQQELQLILLVLVRHCRQTQQFMQRSRALAAAAALLVLALLQLPWQALSSAQQAPTAPGASHIKPCLRVQEQAQRQRWRQQQKPWTAKQQQWLPQAGQHPSLLLARRARTQATSTSPMQHWRTAWCSCSALVSVLLLHCAGTLQAHYTTWLWLWTTHQGGRSSKVSLCKRPSCLLDQACWRLVLTSCLMSCVSGCRSLPLRQHHRMTGAAGEPDYNRGSGLPMSCCCWSWAALCGSDMGMRAARVTGSGSW